MSAMLWTFTELFVFSIDVAGALWYLHRKLGTRGTPWIKFLAGGFLIFLILALCYLLAVPDSIRLPLLAAAIVCYSLISAHGSTRQKIFHALIAFLLVGTSDAAVIALLTLLPGVTLSTIMQQTEYRAYSMIISKLLFIYLVFIFSSRKSKHAGNPAYVLIMSSVPLVSMAILATLIQYESHSDNHSSYALIAMSIGLFVLNIALLLLHDRLAANTMLLVEKQKMLQQSELQNRHFNETLAATDNMQGFRHDMKNHMQVLSGYLEMNNAAKAREYLNEIGSFMYKNECSLKSGYPLVDAVLGSKIAIAKKLNIQTECNILLNREIGIEQLDLCSLLGNTLDNALEACERITDLNAHRRIWIELRSLESATELTIANTVNPADTEAMDALKSNKPGEGHGIGLAIVRRTVQKYKGTLEIAHTETEFEVRILVPMG